MDLQTFTSLYCGSYGVTMVAMPSLFHGSGIIPYFNSELAASADATFYARMFGFSLVAVAAQEMETKGSTAAKYCMAGALVSMIMCATGTYDNANATLFMIQSVPHGLLTAKLFGLF